MKRLIFAAFLAAGIHAFLFWVELPWSQPTLVVPSSRAVTIDMVTFHTPMGEPKPIEPKIVKPAPMTKPAPKRKPYLPKPKPKPKPTPKPVAVAATPPEPPAEPTSPAPEPATVEDSVASDSIDSGAITNFAPLGAEAHPDTSGDAVDDQAEVRESEPLYHLNPSPNYPRVARRRNYQGTVILDVLVTTEGLAAEVQVATSSGYAVLDRSAVKTVKAWKFLPARRGDNPIEMRVKVPVRFELH